MIIKESRRRFLTNLAEPLASAGLVLPAWASVENRSQRTHYPK
jgi:hypothetical protein